MGFLGDDLFILVDAAHSHHHSEEEARGWEEEQIRHQKQDPAVRS